jgi:hypothetical protein
MADHRKTCPQRVSVDTQNTSEKCLVRTLATGELEGRGFLGQSVQPWEIRIAEERGKP